MSATEATRDRVIAAIAEIMEIEVAEVRLSDRLREDLGMDSLASLELLSTLSEEMRLDLEMEDAMGIATVNDACDFIQRHRDAGQA